MQEKQILEEQYLETKQKIQLELAKIKEALSTIEGSKKLIDSLGEKLHALQKDYEKLEG